MMAFTLVGLMLSLFGGIFAALSAFRTYSEADIRERCLRRDLHVKDLDAASKSGQQGRMVNTIATAEKHARSIQKFRAWWIRAQLFPTVLFLIFALYMACWAMLNWAHLTEPQGWYGWKCIVGTGVLVDVGSLVFMVFGWKNLRSHSNSLDDHMQTVQELTADIKPDPQR